MDQVELDEQMENERRLADEYGVDEKGNILAGDLFYRRWKDMCNHAYIKRREKKVAKRKIYLDARNEATCRLYYEVFERYVDGRQTGETLMLSQQLAWLRAQELVDDIIGAYEGRER